MEIGLSANRMRIEMDSIRSTLCVSTLHLLFHISLNLIHQLHDNHAKFLHILPARDHLHCDRIVSLIDIDNAGWLGSRNMLRYRLMWDLNQLRCQRILAGNLLFLCEWCKLQVSKKIMPTINWSIRSIFNNISQKTHHY